MRPSVRPAARQDFEAILAIVNDAAQAYRGAIPPDRWHEPYMGADELAREIEDGIAFWIAEREGAPLGAMGIQDKGEVALVRHAYVATSAQRGGIGRALLEHVRSLAAKPVLLGTWADARWAVDFYLKNGFRLIEGVEKDALLRRYWNIPARQVETSVVLADPSWMASPLRRIPGGCLCGAVRFEAAPPFVRAGHCHCSRCRRHSGSFGLTQALMPREQFRLLQGEEKIRVYGQGQGAVKAFCMECGSSLFGHRWPEGRLVSIRMGAFDGDPGIRPQFHTWVGSKAPWDEIRDGLPCFAAGWHGD